METINLNGKWQVQEKGGKKNITASVPGTIHQDLLKAGVIPDPFPRDNELDVMWVGERDWIYTRTFNVPAKILTHKKVLLKCAGLDTLAEIRINGKKAGASDNMFRSWEFDIKKHLVAGKNTIEITFASALKYAEKHDRKRHMPEWSLEKIIDGVPHLRKEQCNFGWDWGIMTVTCGIWRDIYITAFDTARIDSLNIIQKHGKGKVDLEAVIDVERSGRQKLLARVTVSQADKVIAEEEISLAGKSGKAKLTIKNPRLWWPNNMGEQPLYEVKVGLFDSDGVLLDATEKRIGLRTLRLERQQDKWGESFHFAVNGVPFFAKGANWIPADVYAPRVTVAQYANLLTGAAAANMNMLRIWGGGIYEEDVFYDLCDELGICIWQDFMFACAAYPSYDQKFMENVRREAEENVRHLRHHPCIALWCGNNELEQGLAGDGWAETHMSWEDYSKLFDKLLPDVVKELHPDCDYWPGSPHTPGKNRDDFNDPTRGDAHLWEVWHRKEPFEWYRTCDHRFNSEFGFQSFPEPKTVYGYTDPEDRSINSRVMEHHQRSGIGNSTIIHYMLDWFRLPDGFDNTLWASQILQGMAIKYAVEHWRRQMPRGMGTLYWQLNDTWPVASWSSIDYHLRWKALHYMARKFYNPTLISVLEDMEKGTAEIHVTSDQLKKSSGTISWLLTDTAGKTLKKGSKKVAIPANASGKLLHLDLKKFAGKTPLRNAILWVDLKEKGRVVSENISFLARPKHIDLVDPKITASIKADGEGAFTVTLKSKAVALWTWLELTGMDADYEDNFVHLRPGRSLKISVRPAKKITLAQMRKALKVSSLFDTY